MDYSLLRETIRPRVEINNERIKAGLIKQLRSPLGVIPFLGAGVSAPFKYRQWGTFLSGTAREQLGGPRKEAIDKAVTAENYFAAAALLAEYLGEREFQRLIADEFSDDRLRTADLRSGTLGYLPLLTAGPVITTNFDRVVEHVFERQQMVFEKVYGANPDQVVPAIQQNRLMLWKIHGDRDDPRTRVFSEAEYQTHYKLLPGLLTIALLNRPALFIGCSLDKDRTTEVLEDVRNNHPGTPHFAFLQIPESDDEFDARADALRKMGVLPIWYRKGQFAEIEEHLADLVQGISGVRLPNAEKQAATMPPAVGPEAVAQVLEIELGDIEYGLNRLARDGQETTGDNVPYPAIVGKLLRGKLAFFLGAYACLGRLPLGRQFYDHLLAELGESELLRGMEAPRITQHYADRYKRDALYLLVNQKLGMMDPSPTIVHQFIASIGHRLGSRGAAPPPQLIFTTNYDNWMEHTLQMAGVPYHLFTYRVSDPHAGHFIHQDPSGEVHLIDRPSHVRRLPEHETVVVKLHGGIHRAIDLPVSYAFMHRDFIELAGRLDAVLPYAVLDRLRDHSVLFLGSGLGDDSIESLVRWSHDADPTKLSWAVQLGSRPEMRAYWRALGLDILEIELQRFMVGLNGAFSRLAGPAAGV
jgi:hypothetical protein